MGFEDENSAGPVSGRINYNTVEYAHRNSGHGNYDLFQSTRFLDHQNKALAAEKVQPEHIRDINQLRLEKLAKDYEESINSSSMPLSSFDNLKKPSSLKNFDSNISKFFTPEPKKLKSLGLLQKGGQSIISNRLTSIEEDYHYEELYKPVN